MKQLTILSLLLVTVFTGFTQSTWKVDKAHSQLKFDITHMGISTVSGAYTDFDVTILSSKEDFSDAVFELTVQSASINTGIAQRDEHLKAADFFDVANYPVITFKSTAIKKVKDAQYQLTGNLTMHGITKQVTMDLWYRGTIEHPMSKKPDAGFRLTGSLNRSDFGVGTKFPAGMLGESVAITADGEFIKE